MTSAGRDRGTAEVTRQVARGVRFIVVLSVALFFVQLTVLAPDDATAALGFSSKDLGVRWWTVASFTFVHSSAWPLLANLSVIGLFGAHLERAWGTWEFARYYIICALGAWIAHIAFVSSDVVLAGSAAPAIGCLLAFAAMNGDDRHFRVGAISLSTRSLAVIGTIGLLAAGVAASAPDTVATYLVHGAGVVAGWGYLRTASSISLVRLRDAVSQVPDEAEDAPPRAVPRQHRGQRQDDDIVARSNAAVAREAAARSAPAAPPARDPASLDRMLDKISEHGIDSLSPDERRLLDEMSRRLRDT